MLKKMAGRLFPKMLHAVPKNKKWLYPFYLAGQLDLSLDTWQADKLPAAFDGFKIAYASDIHHGPLLKKDEALRVFDRLLALDSDLIILGGDYGDVPENSRALFELLAPFPTDKPVLAVLGNHDYTLGQQTDQALLDSMRRKNVLPLVNQVYTIKRAGSSLAICGPDDERCGNPQFEPLIAESRNADLVLFIPHSPDQIPDAQAAGFRFDLAICGHTHGGQVAIGGRSVFPSSRYKDRYRHGWYREMGADILVSGGVGTSILPVRLGTRPQIHLLTLAVKAQG